MRFFKNIAIDVIAMTTTMTGHRIIAIKTDGDIVVDICIVAFVIFNGSLVVICLNRIVTLITRCSANTGDDMLKIIPYVSCGDNG